VAVDTRSKSCQRLGSTRHRCVGLAAASVGGARARTSTVAGASGRIGGTESAQRRALCSRGVFQFHGRNGILIVAFRRKTRAKGAAPERFVSVFTFPTATSMLGPLGPEQLRGKNRRILQVPSGDYITRVRVPANSGAVYLRRVTTQARSGSLLATCGKRLVFLFYNQPVRGPRLNPAVERLAASCGDRDLRSAVPEECRWLLKCFELANWGCVHCPHFGLRIGSYAGRTGPDSFLMFPGVPCVCKGGNAVRVPPRAQCIPRSEAFCLLTVDKA
jgi:hypothetical protein